MTRRWFTFAATGAARGPAGETPAVTLTDSVTKRKITWYKSAFHESHTYYTITPWSPDENRILFFQWDKAVAKLDARRSFPGTLWVMDSNGSGRKIIAGNLSGGYHGAAGQFWGPGGKTVYFAERRKERRGMGVVDLESGQRRFLSAEVPFNVMSPDFTRISCVSGKEWGVYDIARDRYTRLFTLDQALSLTPHRGLTQGLTSHLQNTRFSPDGSKCIIVHRTDDDPPSLVEVFAYDFAARAVRHVCADLHHPTWRPDSRVILFVRRNPRSNDQTLWEVDVEASKEVCVFDKHVPAGHPSYHPRKPHIVMTDCYGGDFGYGLCYVNLQTREIAQLVAVPLGSRPAPIADPRFPFRNYHIWIPPRAYLNEPRPVWSRDGSKVFYTSEESGKFNLYVADTPDV